MEEEQEQDEKKEEEKEDVSLYACDHGPCMMHDASCSHPSFLPHPQLDAPLPCLPLSEADARMHTTSLRMLTSAERSVTVKGMPHPTRIGWERDKQMDKHVDGWMEKDGRIDCAR